MDPTERVEILVLGGGPTGLGAGWRLCDHPDVSWSLIEASPEVGGLAGSCIDEAGFTWDFGGHVLFTRYPEFEKVLAGFPPPGGWRKVDRRALALVAGRWVPYPVQQHLDALPSPHRELCESEGRRVRALELRSADLETWARTTLGLTLTDLFFRPYNEKVWQTPLRELGTYWLGDRVALPSGTANKAWGPNAVFRYPARGGMGAFWRHLGTEIGRRTAPGRLRSSTRAVSIDLDTHCVTLSDGSCIAYEWLISTVPLLSLLDMAGLAGTAGRRVRHTSVQLIGFGLGGHPPAELESATWCYFADSELPFYRAVLPRNLAPANCPGQGSTWSVLLECPLGSPDSEISIKTAMATAIQSGVLPPMGEVLSTWTRRLPFGYPIPLVNREKDLGPTLARLERRQVLSRGRFGAWRYEISNQDHSFMQGLEAVDRIVTGAHEPTIRSQPLDLLDADAE